MQLQFVYGNPSKIKKKKRSVKVAKKKKVKKSKSKKTSRRKRRAKRRMVSHRHAATVRHISKGAKAKAKIRKGKAKVTFRRGKKKVRVSAVINKKKSTLSLRVNPRRKHKRRKNPESVYLIPQEVYGKTKTGKPAYRKIPGERRVSLGSQPTLGETKYYGAQHTLHKERGRLAKTKASKERNKKQSIKYGKEYAKAKKRRSTMRDTIKASRASLAMAGGGVGKGTRLMRSAKITKLKANPFGGTMNKVENLLGTSMVEVGGLAAGGLLYGAVNAAAARYVRPVHQQLVKIPVVGTALPTLLIGALANYLGERQGIDALKVVGRGLVGASVVGMGVNASQMVPGLKPSGSVSPVAGLGYEEMYGLPEGLGNDGADFGSDEADFGGIDYTMEGIDYTMEGQLGDEADFGGVDYTMEGIPEGMGEGQLG